MTGLIALDVVIGLIFIYLLYSLLGTLVTEIISINLGLRARNLFCAIHRMFANVNVGPFTTFLRNRFFKSIPGDSLIERFYRHPEIKYQAANRRFSKPSGIDVESFSKTLLDLFEEIGKEIPKADDKIKAGIENSGLDDNTRDYLLRKYERLHGDYDSFKVSVENWYDNTMKQATEWYKRNIQILLFFIGFGIAWAFNVDTFVIVKKLSKDKGARENMVNLASSYLQKTTVPDSISIQYNIEGYALIDSSNIKLVKAYNVKMDSLLRVREELNQDMREANEILGVGGWLPDSLEIGSKGLKPVAGLETNIVPKDWYKDKKEGFLTITTGKRIAYYFLLLWEHFMGYAVTALAISLGSPFWFDLLSRIMKLRASLSSTNGKLKT